jgi:4-alpha-glucanotransferase
MPFPRATGILLHPTSLPSRSGIGDFGPAAYEFVDFLANARQSLWQLLPLGPLGYGFSPYSSTSAFAGNPLLISLERLAEYGWLERSHLSGHSDHADAVDYPQMFARKMPLLAEAARHFIDSASGQTRERFESFCNNNQWWLEDFVLFDALRARFRLQSWNHWPRGLAHRQPAALAKAREELAADLNFRRAIQFAFYEQWRCLHSYCRRRSIRIIGDIAIFVNYDSADVWTYPELFCLDENLEPVVVSGVPPDFFSKTGQRWGNPLYRWDVMRSRGYEWWVQRLRWATQNCDYIRLDHFRGFEQFWEIAANEPTAINGRWVDGPKDNIFKKLREVLGGLPFFAEDLGYITPEVHALRDRLHIPGMAVLQFGFADSDAHMYLPHRCTNEKVIYTGTHDNDTLLGWWRSGASAAERKNAEYYLGRTEDGIHWAFIRAAQTSVASLSVIPLQDVLGLGSEARMNTPSENDGNWKWRFQPGALTRDLAQKLALLAEVTDRFPEPAASAPVTEDFCA